MKLHRWTGTCKLCEKVDQCLTKDHSVGQCLTKDPWVMVLWAWALLLEEGPQLSFDS